MKATYQIPHILAADEKTLSEGVFVVLLHALRTPPHLLLMVQGRIFTLSVKGATVDGALPPLLTLINRKKIETVFIRLALPKLITIGQLTDIVRKCTLTYPHVAIDTATCLSPIRDFCHSVYHIETKKVNLIFDLLNSLQQQDIIGESYHLNLQKHLDHDSLFIRRYSVHDVYEAIRQQDILI